jgi:hypothetical protein
VFLSFILVLSLLARTALAATVYVDGRVGSSGDGASWATARKTIQEGIDAANGAGGGEVWVVQGTYHEAITMKSNVLLYGGFLGTETDLLERTPASNITTIDGSTARGGLPAYHVVVMDNIITATLDGFTIMGGRADGPTTSYDAYGGGMFCLSLGPSIAITNCRIDGSFAAERGGGMHCEDSSSFSIVNCTISNNSSGDMVGGCTHGMLPPS